MEYESQSNVLASPGEQGFDPSAPPPWISDNPSEKPWWPSGPEVFDERPSRFKNAARKLAGGVSAGQISTMLSFASWLLPSTERKDWIEENRSYLANTDGCMRKYWWAICQFFAMPRYAYTVRTDSKQESA